MRKGKTSSGHLGSRRTGDHQWPAHRQRACPQRWPLMRAHGTRKNPGREVYSHFHAMQNWQELELQWLFNSKLDTARREEPTPTRPFWIYMHVVLHLINRQTSKSLVLMSLPYPSPSSLAPGEFGMLAMFFIYAFFLFCFFVKSFTLPWLLLKFIAADWTCHRHLAWLECRRASSAARIGCQPARGPLAARHRPFCSDS